VRWGSEEAGQRGVGGGADTSRLKNIYIYIYIIVKI